MYYIDIIILLIIILIIVILIYDVYKKNIKIIKKIEMFNEFDYDKLGPIKFIDKDDPLHILGYFPNGEGENGKLSAEQSKIIKDKGLSMTTIRIPRGTVGEKGDKGIQGPVGDEGLQGTDGKLFTGEKGDNGSPAPSCTDGSPAPACEVCTNGTNGTPADPCGASPQGPRGDPAPVCQPGDKGERGDNADPCISRPPPGAVGGAQHGTPASPCNCICATCAPAQCVDNVDLRQINGTNLVINSNNININRTLKMNNNSEICFGNSCINKNIIDRINNI
tara:strand:+ start:6230 stop:7063 length:834 start_codon:yes stop_codon:yes gene_type:complete